MSKTRTRTLVLGALLALALVLPACTRSASTPPAEQGTSSSPLDSQQATMEAVRAALLTQTAQAEQAAPADLGELVGEAAAKARRDGAQVEIDVPADPLVLAVRADAICVHSDTPNAVAIARTVREAVKPYLDAA